MKVLGTQIPFILIVCSLWPASCACAQTWTQTSAPLDLTTGWTAVTDTPVLIFANLQNEVVLSPTSGHPVLSAQASNWNNANRYAKQRRV
jgi:hypothetical protein